MRAARRLFAECDIGSVGIRDIASAAGVSHGLVQRYCGTREQMIAQIVRQEVERFSVSAPTVPTRASPDEFEDLRELLKAGMHRFEEYAPRPGAGECLRQREPVRIRDNVPLVNGGRDRGVPGSLQSEPEGPVRNDVFVGGARPGGAIHIGPVADQHWFIEWNHVRIEGLAQSGVLEVRDHDAVRILRILPCLADDANGVEMGRHRVPGDVFLRAPQLRSVGALARDVLATGR